MTSVPGKGNFAKVNMELEVCTDAEDDVPREYISRIGYAIANGKVEWLDKDARMFDFQGYRYIVQVRTDNIIFSVRQVSKIRIGDDGEKIIEPISKAGILAAMVASCPEWAQW